MVSSLNEKVAGYQRALATFTRIVCEADSATRLLQNAVAQVARITDIKHVKALRYRPDRGDLLIEAGVGWRPGVVGHVSFGLTGILHRDARFRQGSQLS